MLLCKIFYTFLVLAATNTAFAVQITPLGSNRSKGQSSHLSQASHFAQTSHSGPLNHSGSEKKSSVPVSGSQHREGSIRATSQHSEQKISTGYRAISVKEKPPPEAPPLSKAGHKYETEQWRLGKNNQYDPNGFLNGQIQKSGAGLTEAMKKENRYTNKMKSAQRNPNSVASKVRSVLPGTMEYKRIQAVKQTNKHASALTDVLHDTRVYKMYGGMSKKSADELNTKAHAALRQRYVVHK